MTITKEHWYQYIQTTTTQIITTLRQDWAQINDEQWQWKAVGNQWSMTECLEHLNIYARFYHKEIARITAAAKPQEVELVKSNWFGKFSINSVKLGADGLPVKKAKTLKKFQPVVVQAQPQVVYEEFLQHQQTLLKLLDEAKHLNLNKLKVKTPLHALLKLRLGDCFHFVVAHNERHIAQAKKIAIHLVDGLPQQAGTVNPN